MTMSAVLQSSGTTPSRFVPDINNQHVQHSEAILATILNHLWGYPTHPSSLIILQGTNSTCNFFEGGHLVGWQVLGCIPPLLLHPGMHCRLHRPMTVQQHLEVLLTDICFLCGICCVAAIRPAQLASSKGLHPVKLISETNTLVG